MADFELFRATDLTQVFDTAALVDLTPETLVFLDGLGRTDVDGAFALSPAGAVDGTVTGLRASVTDGPRYSVTGVEADAAAVVVAVQTNDATALISLLAVGDDRMAGSDEGDVLRGFGGDDLIEGRGGADLLFGDAGDDTLLGGLGSDTLVGGGGQDVAVIDAPFAQVSVSAVPAQFTGGFGAAAFLIGTPNGQDHVEGVETLEFSDQTFTAAELFATLGDGATPAQQSQSAATGDVVLGSEGADTIVGGTGDDTLTGGQTATDLRDEIFGGAGDDLIDGGAGNDELRGDAGNDTLRGGSGVDALFGGDGADEINGGASSDLIFGGAGDDFVNGGFGSDRVNGGAGADTFFHLGVPDHGSDWIQDFSHAEGDVLRFGQEGATSDQFQVNFAATGAAGSDDVDEAFVVYQPTGQILWALVDGAAQDSLTVHIAGTGEAFDLLG